MIVKEKVVREVKFAQSELHTIEETIDMLSDLIGNLYTYQCTVYNYVNEEEGTSGICTMTNLQDAKSALLKLSSITTMQ